MPLALKAIPATIIIFLVAATTMAIPTTVMADERLAAGKEIAFDRKKGNCLACHVMDDGELPGNIGPPLVTMKSRFPDRAVLRAQIYDARVVTPNSIMIPFGAHGVLTDDEIDKVTDYVHSL